MQTSAWNRRLTTALLSTLGVSLACAAPALAGTGDPAGGAETSQVVIATVGACAATAVLLWLITGHRSGRRTLLTRVAAFSERVSGLPGWAALPSALMGGALLTALFGMYWDISLHIDDGRDAGPLANPAHYFILAGLFGVFAAGCLAITLPRGERPGPAALKLGSDWHTPVGGVLIAACGAYSLIAFPLDDMWHRLFGQDVTLWGPTHLMLIGGAGMTLIGGAVLLAEGMSARRREGAEPGRGIGPVSPRLVTGLRRLGLMGGLLIGLSTFQAEFDFGVPQFALVFQPILVAFAAGAALVAARIWIGPGGALGAAGMFLVVRGGIAVTVGPVLGEVTPYLPLYLAEAALVEAAALLIGRGRPLALGAAGGLLAGTAGFWSEYAWSHVVMPHAWNGALLPEGLVFAALAGLAGGLLGGLLGAGLRGELPRPGVARPVFLASLFAIGALVANGLLTEVPDGVRATVTLDETRPAPQREALATVRFDPPGAAEDAQWVSTIAWGGGGTLQVDELERVREGVYRSNEPLPLNGEWKTSLRLQRDRQVVGVPIFMPEDSAIPARGVPAPPVFTRTVVDETKILQREQKDDVPSWLWAVAELIVLALSLFFIATLAWGLARVARRDPRPDQPPRPLERPGLSARTGRLTPGALR